MACVAGTLARGAAAGHTTETMAGTGDVADPPWIPGEGIRRCRFCLVMSTVVWYSDAPEKVRTVIVLSSALIPVVYRPARCVLATISAE